MGLVRHRLQRRARQFGLTARKRKPRDHPARFGPPVRCAKACQRGHDHHPAAIRDRARERLGILGQIDDPEGIAQPLHQAPGDKHRAFDGIGARALDLGQNRAEQAVGRARDAAALTGQHESPGAIGRLGLPRREARLPDGRGLLVTGEARDRNRPSEQRRIGHRQRPGHVGHPRKRRQRHAEKFTQPVVELRILQPHQERAAGVAGVTNMRRSAGELEGQPAFDRPEGQRALLRSAAHLGHVVEHPAHLGAREIGIEQQPGALLHPGLVPRIAQGGAKGLGAAVLPYDGVGERLAGGAIPRHHGLALVGNADTGDRRCPARLVQHRLHAGERLVPDLARIMLDPAGLRIVLGQRFLRTGEQHAVMCKQHRAGRGGAFVEH